MSIWLELLALMLVAYAAGLALGWWLWGRAGAKTNGREASE